MRWHGLSRRLPCRPLDPGGWGVVPYGTLHLPDPMTRQSERTVSIPSPSISGRSCDSNRMCDIISGEFQNRFPLES
jgi:hypothetical protein